MIPSILSPFPLYRYELAGKPNGITGQPKDDRVEFGAGPQSPAYT